MRPAAAPVLLLVLGCASPRLPRAEDYDRSCSTDADCAVVTLGLPCSVCAACADTALNARDVPEATADYLAARAQCAPRETVSCGPCPEPPRAVCQAGSCALAPVTP
jgi:hypothetical protein